MTTTRRSLPAALALTSASLLLVGAPATAHEATTYAYQGKDHAAIVGDTGDGYVLDKECDGHAVRVALSGRKFTSYITDENGCAKGGGRFDFGDDGLDGMRVEERQDDGSWDHGASVAIHDH
jgi:hypothetical protein